ncbi:MAG: hypothetical protein WAJ85_00125 [Candidatus Baltobacteraceae bacterium]
MQANGTRLAQSAVEAAPNAPRSKSVCTIGYASTLKPAAQGITMKLTMRNASEILRRIPARFELANWPAISGKVTVAIAAATIVLGKYASLVVYPKPAVEPALSAEAK